MDEDDIHPIDAGLLDLLCAPRAVWDYLPDRVVARDREYEWDRSARRESFSLLPDEMQAIWLREAAGIMHLPFCAEDEDSFLWRLENPYVATLESLTGPLPAVAQSAAVDAYEALCDLMIPWDHLCDPPSVERGVSAVSGLLDGGFIEDPAERDRLSKVMERMRSLLPQAGPEASAGAGQSVAGDPTLYAKAGRTSACR